MSEWVAVVQDEGDEPIEIPTESDSTILLTSLTAQFPGVTGLKFRNPETNVLRGVRCLENQLYPPYEDGWGNYTYICVHPRDANGSSKQQQQGGSIQQQQQGMSQHVSHHQQQDAALKRKSEYDGGVDGMSSKNIKFEDMEEGYSNGGGHKSSDLIVLGLHWQTTEQDIREYFETFGELAMVQLKTKIGTNQSKGFAFIRYVDPNIQSKVLLTRHLINDRWCDVKIPDSQELKNSKLINSCKIFVGRITENMDPEDIRNHFESFGTVTDIYIPKPFKAFAFVTFDASRVAQSLWGKEHTIKGVTVYIASAHSKVKEYEMGRNGGLPRLTVGRNSRVMDGRNGGGNFPGSYHPHQMERQNYNVWSHQSNGQAFGGFNGRGGGKGYY